MAGMLLLLLQAPILAKQMVPNVYVTVQQPVGGMPEWIKILITAVISALFAFGVALLTERMKLGIAKTKLKKEASEQMLAELKRNMDKVATGQGSLFWMIVASRTSKSAGS